MLAWSWVNVCFAVEALVLFFVPTDSLKHMEIQAFMVSSLVWTSLFVREIELFRLLMFLLSLVATFLTSDDMLHQMQYIWCMFFSLLYPLLPEMAGLNDTPKDLGERQVVLHLPLKNEQVVAVELMSDRSIAGLQPWCMTQWFQRDGRGTIPSSHFSKRVLRHLKVNHLWTVRKLDMKHNICHITLE